MTSEPQVIHYDPRPEDEITIRGQRFSSVLSAAIHFNITVKTVIIKMPNQEKLDSVGLGKSSRSEPVSLFGKAFPSKKDAMKWFNENMEALPK